MTDQARTILLTGGAGFIGSHVVDRLLAAGHTVINLDLLTYAGTLDNLVAASRHAKYRFQHGSISDGVLVTKLLAEHRPDVIFNIAAETHVDRSIDDAAAFIDTNVAGVFRLLDCALDYWRGLPEDHQARFRFIQMSTDEVYGSIATGVFTEESNYAPNSPYAASKAAGDHMVRAYRVTFGLPTAVVHASNTYGPRQHPEKLIPHTVLAALEGRSLPVYGDGTNVRDWLFVADLADGLARVAAAAVPGEVYNFSGGDERRNLDTVKTICAQLSRLRPHERDYMAQITFVPDRPGHDFRYARSFDRVGRTFGWRPSTGFEKGLAVTLAWYLENSAWCRAVLARGYDGARIGTRSAS